MSLKDKSFFRELVYIGRNILERYSFRKGSSNRIIVRGGIRVNSRIQIRGNRNTIVLEKGCVLKNSLIRIQGDNNQVILKPHSYISGAELWVENNGCRIMIGENSFIGHHSHLACTEDEKELLIGSDCMVSSYVQIRTGDSHSILDVNGERINFAVSVNIGNHCWIGEGAKILKGVSLEGDDIVATGAIVTSSFGKNVLIGGVPARVLKSDVSWDSSR